MHISVWDLDGKMIRYHVAKDVQGSALRAVRKFNAEQQRAYARQLKSDNRHLDDRELERIFIHVDYGDFKEVMSNDTFGGSVTPNFAAKKDLWLAVRDVLDTCTTAQQVRFRLWLAGYNYAEIAVFQHCRKQAVWESVQEIIEKLKKSLMTALSNSL